MSRVKSLNLLLVIVLAGNCLGIEPNSPPTGEQFFSGKTISEWVSLTGSADPNLQTQAAWMLGQIGPPAKSAVPVLVNLLANQNPKTRECAAYALRRIGPDAKPAIPALIALLKDVDMQVRWQAADALGAIGPAANEALSALIKLLNAEDWKDDRPVLIHSLGSIGEANAKIVVPVLLELLRNPTDRGSAVVALGNIGPDAKSGIPALFEVLSDANVEIRLESAKSLQKIDRHTIPRVLPTVISLLEHEKFWVRQVAAETLGGFGSDAKEAIPALKQLANDPAIQKEVLEALRKITEHN